MAARDMGLKGLWVPIVTPFTAEDRVDYSTLNRLARRLLTDGCAGLVALGTTGEPATLTRDERQRVVETCAGACDDAGKPLIVGIGSNCTRSTIEEGRWVSGVARPAALLVVVPYYVRPSERGVIEHFRAVNSAVSAPVLIYNIPYRTGCKLSARAVLELAELDGVVGLKQSVGALDHDTLEILAHRPDRFHVLAGDDAYIAPTVLMGATGAIAAAGHVCTTAMVSMVNSALAGDGATAAACSRALQPVITAGYIEPNPAGWKAALHGAGEISSPRLRSPMTEASPATAQEILAAIERFKRWEGAKPYPHGQLSAERPETTARQPHSG